METIRYGSMDDLGTYTTGAGVVPLSETDAIIMKDIDVDATSVTSVGGNTQATLYIDFTKGSLTNVIIKFYGSYKGNPTASDWFTETDESDSSGTLTLNPLNITITDTTALKMWHFPIGACRAYKITVTGTGTATSSSLKLYCGLRSN